MKRRKKKTKKTKVEIGPENQEEIKPKKKGRPKGSKNKIKETIIFGQEIVEEPKKRKRRRLKQNIEVTEEIQPVIERPPSNLFTISQNELFNIVSRHELKKNISIEETEIFVLYVEKIKNGNVYFSLRRLSDVYKSK